MNNKKIRKSIIWRDCTEKADRSLIAFLVNKTVCGFEVHKKECIEKILKTIKTKKWQNQYLHRGFVFSILYSLNAKIIEIKYSLSCQALDSLYFQLSRNNTTNNFAKKFAYVFIRVFGRNPPQDTTTVLRIIRNDVMHTGEIMGISASRRNSDDGPFLKQYFLNINKSPQSTNDVQKVISLASSFNYLMEDILMKVLGLSDIDLCYNLNPPSRLNYYLATTP